MAYLGMFFSWLYSGLVINPIPNDNIVIVISPFDSFSITRIIWHCFTLCNFLCLYVHRMNDTIYCVFFSSTWIYEMDKINIIKDNNKLKQHEL